MAILASGVIIGIFLGWLFQSLYYPKAANNTLTTKNTILRQLNEPRPLPLGAKEFKEWSDRIISGAMIPTDNPDSLRAALAVMLQSLGPQESHKPDAYFIHSLRKAAVNEVARHVFTEIKNERDAAKNKQDAPAVS